MCETYPEVKFSEYFGFTESEVDALYKRYLKAVENPGVSREGLRVWYDGYHTKSGERVYNPRSVVASLTNNNLGNYWTSAGPYDEIFYYIEKNVSDVRDDLAKMVAGIPVQAKIQEYAATSMKLGTKNEIFSAMVVYGFLSYENGYVSVPNRELLGKFHDMLQKEPLKVDSTPDAAIQQIKDRQYALRFAPKLGEEQKYSGRVLAVGISYNKKTKQHDCKIEVL